MPTNLKDKSMRELLDLANDLTLNDSNPAAAQFWTEYGREKPLSLFREPATASEIAQLEQRIGITLPEDFKEFLRITNGFGTTDDLKDGPFNGLYPEPAIYGVEKINWTTCYDTFSSLPIPLLVIENNGNDGVWLEEDGSHVLEIGVRDVENLWLLQPERVARLREVYRKMYGEADEEGKRKIDRAVGKFVGNWEAFERLEWCCLRWSAGGAAEMVAWKGFREFLEEVVERAIEEKENALKEKEKA